MSLTIGVLSWGAQKTLRNTLNSYRIWCLDRMADQRIIWFNEMSAEDEEIAHEYGYEYAGSPSNLGIAGGYRELVARSTGSLFLFLENDWVLVDSPYHQIREGSLMLETRTVDCVRYRHRQNPGNPLWSRQFAGNEMSRQEYLLESIHWNEHPEEYVTDFEYHPIEKLSYGWYRTDSRYANWTNNPTMFRRDFIEVLSRGFRDDVEIGSDNWWNKSAFPHNVAQGDGLFTHYRVG